jgi:hypothetical protein
LVFSDACDLLDGADETFLVFSEACDLLDGADETFLVFSEACDLLDGADRLSVVVAGSFPSLLALLSISFLDPLCLRQFSQLPAPVNLRFCF